jgi:hypothetical protein
MSYSDKLNHWASNINEYFEHITKEYENYNAKLKEINTTTLAAKSLVGDTEEDKDTPKLTAASSLFMTENGITGSLISAGDAFQKGVEQMQNKIFKNCPTDILMKSDLKDKDKIKVVLNSFPAQVANKVMAYLEKFRTQQELISNYINAKTEGVRKFQTQGFKIDPNVLKDIRESLKLYKQTYLDAYKTATILTNINNFMTENKKSVVFEPSKLSELVKTKPVSLDEHANYIISLVNRFVK